MASPKPHPEPPTDLPARVLPITSFSNPWFRVHARAHAPLFFGKSGHNRFDAPGREFGVLYVGLDEHCAFIETFGHATGIRLLDQRELASRAFAQITCARPLKLVDLRGEGLARIGADAALTTGLDYDLAQRWSKTLHDHPSGPDGIVYRARHDPERISAALFERVGPDLGFVSHGTVDADPRRLAMLLDTYDFGLV